MHVIVMPANCFHQNFFGQGVLKNMIKYFMSYF